MPTHVSVNKLGLTYKSSIGLSSATLPDVCKTPTPGGPVPIPYPNIADQSTLKKGTKTVKAKRNKMIAIKGSEYSISFGDEPGTVGGVKSSTFKKETSWITYSFDVKMDGKNVCRHTDKKFHNHKNTVDLAGNVDPGPPGGNPLEIKCDNAPAAKGSTKFTNCEKEELCAKCASINEQANSKSGPYGGLKRIRKSAYVVNRSDGDNKCACLNRAARKGKPADLGFCPVSPECDKELRDKAKANNYKGFSPDHIHEIQVGGHPSEASNLRWMSSRPNSWIGGQMKKYDPESHTGVKPDCCG